MFLKCSCHKKNNIGVYNVLAHSRKKSYMKLKVLTVANIVINSDESFTVLVTSGGFGNLLCQKKKTYRTKEKQSW